MTREEFVAMALVHLTENGISVLFKNETRVEGSSGFFCDDDRQLSVATKKPYDLWFLVFIHEYCHFLQMMDPDYGKEDSYPDYYWTRYFSWLEGKRKCSPQTIHKYVQAIRDVEMDCERRVVKLIKKHDLPVDIGEYIQKANAYGFFYTLTEETGKWYSETAPFDYDKAWKTLPKKFAKDYDKVPEDFRSMVMKRCF